MLVTMMMTGMVCICDRKFKLVTRSGNNRVSLVLSEFLKWLFPSKLAGHIDSSFRESGRGRCFQDAPPFVMD